MFVQVHLKLRRVLEERTAQVEAGIPWDETFLSESRTKLISVLQRCSAFRPAEILRLLPKDAFHSERALLLGKLNEHRAVLLILARKVYYVGYSWKRSKNNRPAWSCSSGPLRNA